MSTTQRDVQTVQRYLTHIEEQDASTLPYILHYDIEVGSLRPWLWSVDVGLLLSFNPELCCRPMDEAGEKVTPSALPAFHAEGFR